MKPTFNRYVCPSISIWMSAVWCSLSSPWTHHTLTLPTPINPPGTKHTLYRKDWLLPESIRACHIFPLILTGTSESVELGVIWVKLVHGMFAFCVFLLNPLFANLVELGPRLYNKTLTWPPRHWEVRPLKRWATDQFPADQLGEWITGEFTVLIRTADVNAQTCIVFS